MKLKNKTNDNILAENIKIADTPLKRMKGLLGKQTFTRGEGLHIIPCNSIHSFFMKFKFDAIFLDKNNKILSIIEKMPAFKTKFCIFAHSVAELPEGTIESTNTKIGDELIFEQ